jgi:DNA topoisomerase
MLLLLLLTLPLSSINNTCTEACHHFYHCTLQVYAPWERWSDRNIPAFAVGQEFVPSSLLMTSGRTEPPPLLSESDLIALMDKSGIGTDATIAEHIKKIQVRVSMHADTALLNEFDIHTKRLKAVVLDVGMYLRTVSLSYCIVFLRVRTSAAANSTYSMCVDCVVVLAMSTECLMCIKHTEQQVQCAFHAYYSVTTNSSSSSSHICHAILLHILLLLCVQERDYAERTHDNRFKPAVLGLALVDGYDALGLRLARPELRQAQEADCKKVARGQVIPLHYYTMYLIVYAVVLV